MFHQSENLPTALVSDLATIQTVKSMFAGLSMSNWIQTSSPPAFIPWMIRLTWQSLTEIIQFYTDMP